MRCNKSLTTTGYFPADFKQAADMDWPLCVVIGKGKKVDCLKYCVRRALFC